MADIVLDRLRVEFQLADGRNLVALRDIDLAVPGGEFVCIVGRSGGGKSTLVRTLAGLVQPTAGALLVDGVAVTGPSPERAMVFQDDTVFPWLRVSDNVEFGLRNKSLSRQERAERARSWLDAVGLADFSRAWPKELSGGMRKRVALATVFAVGANVLIMDEPFGALDFVTRATLHQVVLDLWRRSGATIIFVTHDIEEALVLGDRILVVSSGTILDDLRCDLPRPRDEDILGSPRALELRKSIIAHLGLASPRPEGEMR
jgi:NitT/TauT family transport system ATP-binding protein